LLSTISLTGKNTLQGINYRKGDFLFLLTAPYWALFWASWIYSLYPSLRSVSTHPHTNRPSTSRSNGWSFPSGFPINGARSFSSKTCYIPSPPEPHWFDHHSHTRWAVQIINRLITRCSPVSCLVCPNVLLGTLFSKTRHSHVLLLTKTDHVSNPEKATSKYSLVFRPLIVKRKTAGPKDSRYCRHVNFGLWSCTASGTSKNLRTGPSDFRRGREDTESVGWLGPLLQWTEAVIRRSQTGDYKWCPVPRKSSSDIWYAHSYVLPVLTTDWDTKTQFYCLILRHINFFLCVLIKLSLCHASASAIRISKLSFPTAKWGLVMLCWQRHKLLTILAYCHKCNAVFNTCHRPIVHNMSLKSSVKQSVQVRGMCIGIWCLVCRTAG
jgi:hypothetical protein